MEFRGYCIGGVLMRKEFGLFWRGGDGIIWTGGVWMQMLSWHPKKEESRFRFSQMELVRCVYQLLCHTVLKFSGDT